MFQHSLLQDVSFVQWNHSKNYILYDSQTTIITEQYIENLENPNKGWCRKKKHKQVKPQKVSTYRDYEIEQYTSMVS